MLFKLPFPTISLLLPKAYTLRTSRLKCPLIDCHPLPLLLLPSTPPEHSHSFLANFSPRLTVTLSKATSTMVLGDFNPWRWSFQILTSYSLYPVNLSSIPLQLPTLLVMKVKVKMKSLCRVRLFETLWTVVRQTSLSMGFSRQEYWSGFPSPSPGDLPDPGIKPGSPTLQAASLPSDPLGNPSHIWVLITNNNTTPPYSEFQVFCAWLITSHF